MKKTCSAFRDDLPGYRLGEGTPLERERLKAHLEGCADCRAHLAAYELLVQDASCLLYTSPSPRDRG